MAIDAQIQALADGAAREDALPGVPSAAGEGARPARRVRCPRHGEFMAESAADPKTGEGRILRCAVKGCCMVAALPGIEQLRRVLLNRAQRKRRDGCERGETPAGAGNKAGE